MTMKIRVAFLALLLTALPALGAAQSLSGTITGTVTDAQGAVLPGVTVVVTGRQGSQTQVTDNEGTFRFLGLTPGPYSVRAELTGFRPYEETNLDLAIGRTITLKVSMALGGLEETVDVTASPVSVDTTTTATDTTISQELLFSMPISRTNAATSMLNYTPGVNSGSAFGGPAGSGNALMLDGVDTSDPEGGSAWVFFNYNLMDEVQVGALGQPAEYGGFTGAVVNTITKSGGNRYSSLFEYRYTGKGLRGDNLGDDVKAQNPSLLVTGVDKLNDYTVQLGGPIRRDKAFFFASIQRYSIREDPSGPRTLRTEVSPRFNLKVTLQPTSGDNISGTFQYDQYNQTGRTNIFGGAASTTDALSIEQDSPEFVWNGTYRKVLGSTSFFEAKFTGYWGYFDLDPKTPGSIHEDENGALSGGGGYNRKYDRFRNQLNASYSRYVDAGGTHNFKFGVEIERSTTRNRGTYVNDVYFYDVGGVPVSAYSYSYDLEGDTNRNTFYAQDQWSIGRLTANFGVRVDGHRGIGSQDNVKYYSTTAVAPRLGVAIDLTGQATSVLRAFYGQLYGGAIFDSWSRAVPGASDFVTYDVLQPGNRLVEVDRIAAENRYAVDSDIDHARTDEFNVSFEQQVFGRMKATATYIRRESKNFINSVLIDGLWSPVTVTNLKTNQPMTVYRWANRTTNQRFNITNVDEVTFLGPTGQPVGTGEGTRDYNGLMLVFTRPYQNRWQAQASYVFSSTEGTVPSSGSTQFETPNRILINADGQVAIDPRHEFKLFLGYQVPRIEVGLNTYYRSVSGTTYTPFQRIAAATINWPSTNDVFLEPRGSYRNDHINIVDLRLEKVFNAGFNRFGVYADIENLFNVGTVTARQDRYPSAVISGNTVLFGGPTGVTAARQVTFGARWSF